MFQQGNSPLVLSTGKVNSLFHLMRINRVGQVACPPDIYNQPMAEIILKLQYKKMNETFKTGIRIQNEHNIY